MCGSKKILMKMNKKLNILEENFRDIIDLHILVISDAMRNGMDYIPNFL